MRGLTETLTRSSALHVLSTLLEMTTEADPKAPEQLPRGFFASPYLSLIQARASQEELKDCLWSAGISPVGVANLSPRRRIRELSSVKDTDMLVNICIEMVDFEFLDETAQNYTLWWLNEVARERSAVVTHL